MLYVYLKKDRLEYKIIIKTKYLITVCLQAIDTETQTKLPF